MDGYEKMVDKLRQKYPTKVFDKYMATKGSEELRKMAEPMSNSHILATPLVEVLSVTLNKLVDDGRTSYQIYGTIQVIDGEGATFILYNRADYEPEQIPTIGGNLTLTFPSDRAITPSGVVKLEFDLVCNNIEIIKASFSLDYATKTDYNEAVTQVVVGVRGCAVVRYVTYSHAVFSNMQVKLNKKDDGKSCSSANVYGTIVARCHKSNDSIFLFQKKETESVAVEYGTLIPLSRNVVVVPVDSVLNVSVCLWNHDSGNQIAFGDSDFPPNHYLYSRSSIYQNEVSTGIVVQTQWVHAYMQPPLGKCTLHVAGIKRKQEERVILVEVFSVSVWSPKNRDENFNLWGSIKFSSSWPECEVSLFDKVKTSPLRLLSGQMVPITCTNKCYAIIRFGIILHLYDANWFMLSKGDVFWNEDFEEPISWYDRKLCSVVEGDDGYYAAVHYSIFSAGSQATVKIFLKDKSSSFKFSQVRGDVCAYYSNYTYPTHYEREYFRKKLFVSDVTESSLEYSIDSNILLSESVMVVPIDSNLVVDVKLTVETPHDIKIHDMLQTTGKFEEKLVFSTVGCKNEQSIGRAHQEIVVIVEWS